MRDHNHHSPDDTGFCAHCGQPLPAARVVSYGDRKPVNRVGIGVTIFLHLLLLLAFLLKPHVEPKKSAPPAGEITYVAPLVGKPKPQEQSSAPKKQPRVDKPTKPAPPVQIKRLPNTITLPEDKPAKEVEEQSKPKPAPPEMDMSAMIEARRRARGQDTQQQSAEESEAERGMRIAKANIAAANGRSQGSDPNDTGGVFSITNKTFATAELKFRGWNQNFKRRWLQQVTVERGNEPDIETAIIKKMIELIRKEKTGDFEWDSHRLQRVVTMSARPQDQAELEAFLFKEMFPEYKRAPGR
ncbi:MAG: hypothetical protein ACLGI6_02240 [Gammaproteobacteria bacterium]